MVLRRQDEAVADAPREVVETQSVVTCSFLVDRSRWGPAEPFDPSFIFNYEDHDFGVRTRIMGHAVLAVPEATVLHGEGTPGLSFRQGRERSPIRVYCLIRNRWRILLQSFQLRSLLLLAPCLAVYELFQLAAVIRKGWFGIWLSSAGWILGHPGAILRRRHEVQQARRTPDRAFLGGGPLPFTPGLAAGGVERLGRGALDRLVVGYWGLVRRLL
jgi:GT2 family glycosyltransferase